LSQEVRTLLDEPLDAGFYEIPWNGTDQSGSSVQSGIFIYQHQSSEGRYTQSQSRKTFLSSIGRSCFVSLPNSQILSGVGCTFLLISQF
jgi:hypothetical protein